MSEMMEYLGEGLEVILQSQPLTVADASRVAERVLEWTTNIRTNATPATPSLRRPFREIPPVVGFSPPPETSMIAEQAVQCRCLRCIFGPLPFRPIRLDPAWLTPAVSYFAQCIYDERDFDCSPVLADALEEAGCTDADILSHCRQPGEHVRGCWLLDLLLGKE